MPWVNSGGNVHITSGNVGIGASTAPAQKLEVAGDGSVSHLKLYHPTATDSKLEFRLVYAPGGSRYFYVVPGIDLNEPTTVYNPASGSANGLRVRNNGGAFRGVVIYHDDVKGAMTTDAGPLALLPATNVGVGTADPAHKLDVAGDINTTGHLYVASGKRVGFDGPGGSRFLFDDSAAQDIKTSCPLNLNNQALLGAAQVRGFGDKWVLDAAGGIAATGKLRTTVTDPAALEVLNAGGTEGLVVDTTNRTVRPATDDLYALGTTGQRWNGLRVGTGDSSIAGRLGIGATAPGAKLEVAAGALAAGGRAALVSGDVGSGDAVAAQLAVRNVALADSPTRIDFVDTPAGVTTARIESERTPAGGGSLAFGVQQGGLIERLRLDPAGDLTVGGDITTTGAVQAGSVAADGLTLAGTALINPPVAPRSGRLMDAQVNGVSKAWITAAGGIQTNDRIGIGVVATRALDVTSGVLAAGATGSAVAGDVSQGNAFSSHFGVFNSGPADTATRIVFVDEAAAGATAQIESAHVAGGGGYLAFKVRAIGDAALSERLRIDRDGNLIVGGRTAIDNLGQALYA